MPAGDEFGAEPPTEPLPIEPEGAAAVAPHVPIASPQTLPLGSQQPTAARPKRRPRTWLWVVIAALATGAVAAVVTGIVLGGQNAVPAPSPTISSPAAVPSASATPDDDESDDSDSPAPAPPPVEPSSTPAPEPTGDPVPTDTPAAPLSPS